MMSLYKASMAVQKTSIVKTAGGTWLMQAKTTMVSEKSSTMTASCLF